MVPGDSGPGDTAPGIAHRTDTAPMTVATPPEPSPPTEPPAPIQPPTQVLPAQAPPEPGDLPTSSPRVDEAKGDDE
ncbi:hypothetical protein N865_01370 [Intrasporangium oryzae NRRL B-24470]|uniref:Uncharacterized protein n=1 Tax=Intrasporangium oryzae NRRL B-24470 TaxID=1386089 RepID=W9G0K6_9MICO|nr:hypothetical protein N865_01370 [Intrasporangium oryzae NRRL B-24470]